MSNVMTSQRLGNMLTELLESAVFVFSEEVESTPWHVPSIWSASLELEQERKVQMTLAVPKDLALTLAANLLGLEPDSVEAQESLGDAVGEMANMLAGLLAVELFGKDVVCRIGVPEVMQRSGADHDALAAKSCCRASLKTEEGHRVDVCLFEEAVELAGSRSAADQDKTPTPTGDTP